MSKEDEVIISYNGKRYKPCTRSDSYKGSKCDLCAFQVRGYGCSLSADLLGCGRESYYVELDEHGKTIEPNTITNNKGYITKIEFGESYTVIFEGESKKFGDIVIQTGMTMPSLDASYIIQDTRKYPYSRPVSLDRWNKIAQVGCRDVIAIFPDDAFLSHVHTRLLGWYSL